MSLQSICAEDGVQYDLIAVQCGCSTTDGSDATAMYSIHAAKRWTCSEDPMADQHVRMPSTGL